MLSISLVLGFCSAPVSAASHHSTQKDFGTMEGAGFFLPRGTAVPAQQEHRSLCMWCVCCPASNHEIMRNRAGRDFMRSHQVQPPTQGRIFLV